MLGILTLGIGYRCMSSDRIRILSGSVGIGKATENVESPLHTAEAAKIGNVFACTSQRSIAEHIFWNKVSGRCTLTYT